MPTAPPRINPSATAHGTDRSVRAMKPIQIATPSAMIGKIIVKSRKRLNAAPPLRVRDR